MTYKPNYREMTKTLHQIQVDTSKLEWILSDDCTLPQKDDRARTALELIDGNVNYLHALTTGYIKEAQQLGKKTPYKPK